MARCSCVHLHAWPRCAGFEPLPSILTFTAYSCTARSLAAVPCLVRGVSSNARKTAPPPRRSHEMLKSHMACKLYSLLCVDLARARARAGLSAGPDAHKPGRARQYTIVGDMSHVSCPHVRRLAIAVCAAPGVLTVRCAVCPVPRPAGPRQHGPRPRGTEIESPSDAATCFNLFQPGPISVILSRCEVFSLFPVPPRRGGDR